MPQCRTYVDLSLSAGPSRHLWWQVRRFSPQHGIAQLVTGAVAEGPAKRDLLVCGTSVGASIAANKVRGIRAAVCHDIHSAHQCVEHDDVNIMCIGAQIV